MTINISFQTLHLPPPFAYAYTLQMRTDETGLYISFAHEYLHREQITTEEIIEEGFSEVDKFSWNGTLPSVWSDVLEQLIKATSLTEEKPEEEFLESYLYLESSQGTGYPENAGDWQYKMEELIQAIYEGSGREEPFRLVILDQLNQRHIEIQAQFTERKVLIKNQGSETATDWKTLGLLLSSLENMSLPEEGKLQPSNKGYWLTFDEENYFRLKDRQFKSIRELLPL